MENAKCYAPQILVGTEGLPREQWLEYRRKGIGGSDAAAVLGISPFRTGRDLYYDKLNIVTADDAENWVQLEVGTLLEPLVAKIFAHKTGYKIYRRPFMFQHPLYPWMLADLDYMVELPDGTTAILEIKTTNYNAKDNWWYNGEEIVPIYPYNPFLRKISPKNQLPCNQQPAADLFELVALTMLYNRFAHRQAQFDLLRRGIFQHACKFNRNADVWMNRNVASKQSIKINAQCCRYIHQ